MSKTKLVQGFSDRSKVKLDRILLILYERDQFAPPLHNANQCLYGAEQKIYTVKVGKRALVAIIKLHAAEIWTIEAEKESFSNLLVPITLEAEQTESATRGLTSTEG